MKKNKKFGIRNQLITLFLFLSLIPFVTGGFFCIYAGKQKLEENVKNDLDTAQKIGWRIIKDWIHSQLSITQVGLVKVQEVFLPYAYNYQTEKTFYETLEEKKFQGMLLENKTDEKYSYL